MPGKKDRYVDHKLVRYTVFDAISDFLKFLKRFFSKNNLLNSIKNAFGGFREYFVFFAALLLVQMLFWSSVIFTDSRIATLRHDASDKNEYDVLICGLDESEWTKLYNSEFYIKDNLAVGERLYESYSYETYSDTDGTKQVNVSFVLPESTESYSNAFISKYKLNRFSGRVYFGELISSADAERNFLSNGILVLSGLGILSAVILLVLFIIRINHYKFRYGIYMSFGASFGKLFEITAWELFSIAIITFIPSFLLSLGISALIISGSGGVLSVNPLHAISAVFWIFIVIITAVLPSVAILSKQAPIVLLRAEDNSNLVSSPRRSFRIFQKKFPVHYELFGFWRFRKYYAGLLASAVFFSSLFLCGIFIADLSAEKESTPLPQFYLSDESSTDKTESEGQIYSDEIEAGTIQKILSFDNVDCVTWEESTYATEIFAHLVLTQKQSSAISSKRIPAKQDGMYADNNFKFLCVNQLLYSQLSAEGSDMWHIEGDLASIYSADECVVAVSREINNQPLLNFKVGDKIIIGIFDDWGQKIKFQKYDRKYILKQLLSNDNVYYNFIEARIGAIIDTADGDDAYSIAVSPAVYSKLTKRTEKIEELSIYLKDNITKEEKSRAFFEIRNILPFSDGYTLTDTSEDLKRTAVIGVASYLPVCFGSCLTLLVALLVWFFSQSMFGTKRCKETYMLSAFGATDRQLGSLYLFSGGVLTAVASLASAAGGALLNYLVYYLINVFLPSLGFGESVRYVYKLSIRALLLCVAVSAVSAMLSTYLPFRKFRSDRDRVARLTAGEAR